MNTADADMKVTNLFLAFEDKQNKSKG